MKYVLYDILLHLSLLALFPYFVFKMITLRKYREGILERFGSIKREKLERLSGGRAVWVHAVSVGETKAVLPLIRLLKERRPEVKIFFSTVTKTGNSVAEKEGAGLIDALVYFPMDLSWVVRKVIRGVRPKAFIAVEKEVWPNTYRILSGNGIPIIVVNGTISERSFKRFLRFGFFFREIFGSISYFLARTEGDCERAVKAGVKKDRAKAAGNIKFDLKPPKTDPAYLEALKKSLGIMPGEKIIVAGSTHGGEEEFILNAFKPLLNGMKGVRLIIAPRHPERFDEAEEVLKRSGLSYGRRSSGGGGDVILLDTVGELMTAYSFATVALVGGSFVAGIGGHNLLEPAYFGKPVVYGKYLTTYLEMAELLGKCGGGVMVKDEAELRQSVKAMLEDERLLNERGSAARKVVEENRGASLRTVEVIEGFLRG